MSISSYRVILILFSILLGFACASAQAAEGMLVITSSPGGAKIYIDGARKGTTPTQPGKDLALELEEGEYRLEAVLEGERTMKASETVFVPAGGIQPAHLELTLETAMVRIPAGSFKMGCVSGRGCDNDEEPAHTVRVRAFEIGKYEVTFAEWDACVADGGCQHKPDDSGWGRGNRPVINVFWDDAQQYASWLSRKTGQAYRLPTEAEWEYAARAGTTTPYSTGNCIDTSQANYDGNYGWEDCPKTGTYLQKTLPVGRFPANPWGLHDMHGNVWEWVEDCWNDSYKGAPTNGTAWRQGNCRRRVLRGGSWNIRPRYLRSAVRVRYAPGFRLNYLGFRVARTLTP